MLSSTRIDASQLDNWRLVFQSTNEELVTSLQILDIRRCARNGFRGAPKSGRNPRGESFLPSCWHVWSWGRGLLIQVCYSKWNLASSFWKGVKMQSMERHYPQSSWKKQFKKSSSAGKVMINVLWESEGVIIVDMTPRRKTANSDTFIRTLIELR
jgi:hypothetical protein